MRAVLIPCSDAGCGVLLSEEISTIQTTRMRSRLHSWTPKAFASLTIALVVSGCQPEKLPDCVTGNPAPTAAQQALWDKLPAATQLDLGIDGSGSMLGLTGSPQALAAWKGLIKGVSLAASSNGLQTVSQRVGGGESQPFDEAFQSSDPCFFRGCGEFKAVSSSLESFWSAPGLLKGKAPLRLAISDLEVNDRDISKLVGAIRAHVNQGAVIGVLAIRMPFKGKVFNSQGIVIHNGAAKRPIYILTTGPRRQVHALLIDVKAKASQAGVPTESMELIFLDEQANAPTLTARSVAGIPVDAVSGGLPIRLAGSTYSPAGEQEYQFAKLYPKAEGVILSSTSAQPSGLQQPDLGLVRLESIALPGGGSGLGGVRVGGFQIIGSELAVSLQIPKTAPDKALRAFVPRGQLPEEWWLRWNRQTLQDDKAHDQTDGLLLLMTSLSKLMVAPGTTPAASLCLAYSH